jgi:hypothetical protein
MLLARDLPDILLSMSRALTWLLASQEDDGSWLATARIRVPKHEVLDPDAADTAAGSLVILDRKRIFTTATVLATLHAAKDLQDVV